MRKNYPQAAQASPIDVWMGRSGLLADVGGCLTDDLKQSFSSSKKDLVR